MTTYTSTLGLAEPVPLDPATLNVWGPIVNTNMALIDDAVNGVASVSLTGLTTYTMTVAQGATDQARDALYKFTGALTADCTVTLPQTVKIGWVTNGTTGSHNVVLTTGAGTTATIPPSAQWTLFYSDGTNVISVSFSTMLSTTVVSSAGFQATGADSGGADYRMISGSYGSFWTNDGTNTGLYLTLSGAQTGAANTLRPFSVADATGAVSIDGTGVGAAFGGAATFAGTVTGDAGAHLNGYDPGDFNIRYTTTTSPTYGSGWRNDDTNTIFLLTNSGTPFGSFNALRPFTIANATGAVSIDDSGAGVTMGGALGVAGVITAANGVTGSEVVNLSQFPSTLAGNGSITLPGGFMLQWGTTNIVNGGPNTVAFPASFATACVNVSMTVSGATAAGNIYTPLVGSVNANGFIAFGEVGATFSVYWLAIGY